MDLAPAHPDLDRAGRFAAVGAAAVGFLGAIVGVTVGLHTYAPTAWAATFEVGIPAAVVGGVLGLLVAGAIGVVRRLRS